jgi:hypothetical protein
VTEIELPDGTILEAPDGVDPSAVAKAYLAKQRSAQGRMEGVPREQLQAQVDQYNAQRDPTWKDRLQALNAGAARGAAAIAGLPVDTVANVVDLGKAAIGSGYTAITGKAPPAALEVDSDRSRMLGSSQHIASLMNRGGIETQERRPDDAPSAFLAAAGEIVPSVMTPSGARPQAPMVRVPTQAEQVIAQGQKHGVPVFYDDVTDSAMARRVGVAAEPLGPVGTGAGRAAQAKAAQESARNMVNRFAPNTSDDVPEAIQHGMKRRLSNFRTAAGKLYERASKALDPAGNIPTTQMDGAIQTEIARQQSLGTLANPAVTELLQKYQQAPRGNFTAMRELRSQLGSDIADFYTGANKTIGDKGVTALQSMKEALEADMAAFAKAQGGAAEKAWRQADGYYKANIVPFRETGFRDLVKTAEPEKAWRYLVAQGSLKSRAARMYNSLDEEGRSAVRYGLVKEALESGTNPNGSFSPAKFAKYLEDHDQAVNTFFKGRDLQEIRGFQNLMRHVERAGQFAENPPTGQRLVPYLLAAGATANWQVAAGVTASGLTVRALFQTPRGRNMLLALSKAKPGSPQAEALTGQVTKYLATLTADTGAQESGRTGRTPEGSSQ